MRLLIVSLVAGVLALPAPALGQAIQPAALVGTWVYRRDGAEWADSLKGRLIVTYLKVEPNGTFAYDGQIKQADGQWRAWGLGWAKGTWTLAADTLRMTDHRNASVVYKVVLQNGRLLFWTWAMWEAHRRHEKCAEQAFERFDGAQPLTLPPLPQVTIQRAELLGTWAGTLATKQWGTMVDTLRIGEGSFGSTHYGWHLYGGGPRGKPHDRYGVNGSSWAILPGDELKASGLLGRHKIYLQNGDLVFCSPARPVLKRISP